MRIAIVCSNYFNIKKDTANGTAIFNYSFIPNLAERAQSEDLSITAFASGASELPIKTESIDLNPSSADESLAVSGKHVLYEQTLLSKAFSMQDQFDLYHVNIGDGDIALPFSPFVKRPIVITIHHILDTDYMRKFFSLYKKSSNVFFISASNAQRKLLPNLNYLSTIYHGVDPKVFSFNGSGGEDLMWAGRMIPEKGADVVGDVAKRAGCGAKLFGIPRKEHSAWLQEKVLDKLNQGSGAMKISLETGRDRFQLIPHYQTSKAFLFPISYEESFGLVLIEAMSCGTPIIAYAQGSIPEVVEDGKTGFVVNRSDEDIRGDWIIKKSGVEGLREAVDRIYAMSPDEYAEMRRACRERVMHHFTIERMTEEYLNVYKNLTKSALRVESRHSFL